MSLSVIDRMRDIVVAYEAAMAPTLVQEGIAAGEWALLRTSHRLGAVAPSDLADGAHLTRGGVTKLVDRLRAKRLMVRAAGGGEDRRFRTIALTGAGVVLVTRIAEVERAVEARLLDTVSQRDRERLAALLEAIGNGGGSGR